LSAFCDRFLKGINISDQKNETGYPPEIRVVAISFKP